MICVSHKDKYGMNYSRPSCYQWRTHRGATVFLFIFIFYLHIYTFNEQLKIEKLRKSRAMLVQTIYVCAILFLQILYFKLQPRYHGQRAVSIPSRH